MDNYIRALQIITITYQVSSPVTSRQSFFSPQFQTFGAIRSNTGASSILVLILRQQMRYLSQIIITFFEGEDRREGLCKCSPEKVTPIFLDFF